MKTTISTKGRLTSIRAKSQTELQDYLVAFTYNQSAYKHQKTLFIASDILSHDFVKQFAELNYGESAEKFLEYMCPKKGKSNCYEMKLNNYIGSRLLSDFPDLSVFRQNGQEIKISALQEAFHQVSYPQELELLVIEDINVLSSTNSNAYHTLLNLYFFSRKYNLHIVFGGLSANTNAYQEIIDNTFTIANGFALPLKDEDFEFTPVMIDKLKTLNDKIRAEELRMKDFYIKNKALFNEWLKKDLLSDVNFDDTSLSLWNNNDEFNQKHATETGDPFYELKFLGVLTNFDDDDFFNDNWNEFRSLKGHPLQPIQMCYTMHCIVFDTHILSWDDLLNVDDVWMEFNVDFQFFTDKRYDQDIKVF